MLVVVIAVGAENFDSMGEGDDAGGGGGERWVKIMTMVEGDVEVVWSGGVGDAGDVACGGGGGGDEHGDDDDGRMQIIVGDSV